MFIIFQNNLSLQLYWLFRFERFYCICFSYWTFACKGK